MYFQCPALGNPDWEQSWKVVEKWKVQWSSNLVLCCWLSLIKLWLPFPTTFLSAFLFKNGIVVQNIGPPVKLRISLIWHVNTTDIKSRTVVHAFIYPPFIFHTCFNPIRVMEYLEHPSGAVYRDFNHSDFNQSIIFEWSAEWSFHFNHMISLLWNQSVLFKMLSKYGVFHQVIGL